jgi:hypothetical protein
LWNTTRNIVTKLFMESLSCLQYLFLKKPVRMICWGITSSGRRIADRVIWTGLGRVPNVRKDLPTIAIELVSGTRRDRQRDYVDKRAEYLGAGIREYWIIDRFRRAMTVILNEPGGVRELVVPEKETYESPQLPGFQVPLERLLSAADSYAKDE